MKWGLVEKDGMKRGEGISGTCGLERQSLLRDFDMRFGSADSVKRRLIVVRHLTILNYGIVE